MAGQRDPVVREEMRQVGGVSVVSTLNQQNTLRATIGFLPRKGFATSSEVGVHFFDMF